METSILIDILLFLFNEDEHTAGQVSEALLKMKSIGDLQDKIDYRIDDMQAEIEQNYIRNSNSFKITLLCNNRKTGCRR